MAVFIHPTHRALARITYMASNIKGELILGEPELALIMPLLMDNLNIVQQVDGIKEATFAAHRAGNMDLEQHFTNKLTEWEEQLK
ncbi:DUF7667 family protein [Paenibacillus sp. FSL R7-0333]|uniref:DUF7667 family protein n=1 Tax=Paenibacillus sp. FSL R7-0333 TaxID=1926587 RepID=UPI00096E076F|nr:hypothetical protein BK146_16845 [Paenibacillus sp. FSL R7-0333]